MTTAVANDISTDEESSRAFAAARAMCRRRSLDLYLACRLLPRAKADAACAVLAFFDMIADAMGVADLPVNTATAMREHPVVVSPAQYARDNGSGDACGGCGSPDARVGMLRDRLAELYGGGIELPAVESRSEPQHVLSAMQHVVRRFQIPRQLFLDFAEACRGDARVRRYATWRSLERQLDHRAGTVVRAMTCVLGATHSDAPLRADELGRALRLTSILRDLAHDFERGTIYLPLEDLARFRYTERDVAGHVIGDRFRELMRFEIGRARELYRDAAAAIGWLAGEGSRLMAASVIAVHSAVLSRIERAGYDVFTRRHTLAAADKLRRMPLAWRLASRGVRDDAVRGL